MSYDITNKILNARSRADLRAQMETEDAARDSLMSVINRRRPSLTEFEQSFVESWAASPKSGQWWTPKRRDVADELKRKYS